MTTDDREWWRNYDRYLKSYDWQRTRKAAIRRDNYRCQECGTRGGRRNPLQADHLSYDAYNETGRTPVDDLRTLCRSCHETHTGRQFSSNRPTKTDSLLGWIIIIAVLFAIIRGCRIS
jgi:5-methylcytosine-specific restriction endonuclease McrA